MTGAASRGDKAPSLDHYPQTTTATPAMTKKTPNITVVAS
jgi:hypothetical protein